MVSVDLELSLCYADARQRCVEHRCLADHNTLLRRMPWVLDRLLILSALRCVPIAEPPPSRPLSPSKVAYAVHVIMRVSASKKLRGARHPLRGLACPLLSAVVFRNNNIVSAIPINGAFPAVNNNRPLQHVNASLGRLHKHLSLIKPAQIVATSSRLPLSVSRAEFAFLVPSCGGASTVRHGDSATQTWLPSDEKPDINMTAKQGRKTCGSPGSLHTTA